MEYKFRGKSKRTDEWVYGSYHFCNQKGIMRTRKWGTVMDIIEEEVQFNSHWILVHQTPGSPGWDIRETFIPHEVYPETVGQYTGLKDKNEVEIYEDDVVKYYCWSTYEQRSFPEYVDFRETEMKEAIGRVFWNESELSWHVKPNADSKVYNGSEKLVRLEEMPLAYCGLSMEAISEWVSEYEASEEDLKQYTGRDGIEKIGNIHDNPTLNPLKEGVLNMTTDPKEQPAEEVKAPATETEQEQVPAPTAGEGTQEETE